MGDYMKLIRCKWHIIKTEKKFSEIVSVITSNRFHAGTLMGFEIDLLEHKSVDAQYIERYEHVESIVHPDGSDEIIKSTRFNYLSFSIIKSSENIFVMRLDNTPKSTSGFYRFLQNSFPSGFSIEVIKLNIDDFLTKFKKTAPISQFKILQTKISNIMLNRYSSAKVEISSTKNALSDCADFVAGNKFTVDCVKCNFDYNEESETLEIRKTGTIILSENLLLDIQRVIMAELI